jgi:hypothetical protein
MIFALNGSEFMAIIKLDVQHAEKRMRAKTSTHPLGARCRA